MGRSVMTLCNAELTFYFSADWINAEDKNGQYCEFISQINWDDFFENLKYTIKGKLKSYYDCDRWEGQENHIFLENGLAEISIAEYCGSFSLCVRAKESNYYDDYYMEGLAKHHCEQIEKTIAKCLTDCGATLYNRIGTFSNGVSIYEKA